MMHKLLLIALFALHALAVHSVDGAAAQKSHANDAFQVAPRTFTERTIDVLYNKQDLPALAFTIRNLYQEGDAASFVQMVKLQLYLYKKYTDLGDHDDQYVFNLAYYFYQIQNDRLYKRKLPYEQQRTLQQYIDWMPPSVNYLFFKPSFCLLNRHYLEYIYTAKSTEIDNSRRYVFVWNKPNSVGSNGRWIRQITDKSSKKQLKLKFALKSEQMQMFMYIERNVSNLKNLIAAWRPGTEPAHAEWTVELYQDQLIFSQNGRIMCASDELYNKSRRYVYGYKDDASYNEMSAACQWYAKACP